MVSNRRGYSMTIWEVILRGTLITLLFIFLYILLVCIIRTCHTRYLKWQGRRRRNRARMARGSTGVEGGEMALKKPTGPTTTNATRENQCSEINGDTQQRLAVPKEKQKLKNAQDCNGTAVLKALPDGSKELSVKSPEGKKVGK